MNHFHQVLASKDLGGGELVALYIARFLREQGQESFAWIPGAGPAEKKADEIGLFVHRYDGETLFSSSKLKGFICNWKTGRILRAYRPGIIHVHSPFYYRALYPGIWLSRLKCIVHVHLEEKKEGLQWAFKKPPDIIITCAKFLVEYIRSSLPERYQRDHPIVAIPNAVDTKRFRPGDKNAARLRVRVPHGVPLVLMVANLAPHKGQETAIQMVAQLKAEKVDTCLWFVGTERGKGREHTIYLHSLCHKLGIENRVSFLGHREDVPTLLQAADVLLLPSTSEGLPLSILEAQATKLPVVAAPTAGIPEIVTDEKTGFLIPAKDFEGYASRVKLLLSNSLLYKKMTERAYIQIVREHTWRTYCGRINELYMNLLDVCSSKKKLLPLFEK